MKRPVKYIIGGLIIIALLGASPLLVSPAIQKLGSKSLELLAREGGFCESDNCEEGVSYVIAFLETNYGLSEDQIKWCMGVDEVAHYKLPFGNGIKDALAELMYKQCGSESFDMPDDEDASDNDTSLSSEPSE